MVALRTRSMSPTATRRAHICRWYTSRERGIPLRTDHACRHMHVFTQPGSSMKRSAAAGQAEHGNGRITLITRLAAIGGLVASIGVVAFFAFVVYITLPGPYSGLDTIEGTVTWISVGMIAVLAIGVNIV